MELDNWIWLQNLPEKFFKCTWEMQGGRWSSWGGSDEIISVCDCRDPGSRGFFFASYELADDAKKSEKKNCNFCTREPEVGGVGCLRPCGSGISTARVGGERKCDFSSLSEWNTKKPQNNPHWNSFLWVKGSVLTLSSNEWKFRNLLLMVPAKNTLNMTQKWFLFYISYKWPQENFSKPGPSKKKKKKGFLFSQPAPRVTFSILGSNQVDVFASVFFFQRKPNSQIEIKLR